MVSDFQFGLCASICTCVLVSSQLRVLGSEEAIDRGREAYRPIAMRAAVCFDTAQYLREVDSLYQMSFYQFLNIYDTAIAHSDR